MFFYSLDGKGRWKLNWDVHTFAKFWHLSCLPCHRYRTVCSKSAHKEYVEESCEQKKQVPTDSVNWRIKFNRMNSTSPASTTFTGLRIVVPCKNKPKKVEYVKWINERGQFMFALLQRIQRVTDRLPKTVRCFMWGNRRASVPSLMRFSPHFWP